MDAYTLSIHRQWPLYMGAISMSWIQHEMCCSQLKNEGPFIQECIVIIIPSVQHEHAESSFSRSLFPLISSCAYHANTGSSTQQSSNAAAPILVSADRTCFLRRPLIVFVSTFRTQTTWHGGRHEPAAKCGAAPVFQQQDTIGRTESIKHLFDCFAVTFGPHINLPWA